VKPQRALLQTCSGDWGERVKRRRGRALQPGRQGAGESRERPGWGGGERRVVWPVGGG
jgi:hypothetical protein